MKTPRRTKKRLMAEINVVPYIDVMLVLLIIFMITTPLLTQGVHVNLPKGKAKALQHQHQPIIVTVDKKGNFYLNVADKPAQPLTPKALQNLVSSQLTLSKEASVARQVYVRADKDVDYGRVVYAMTLLQQAGAGEIGLMTDNPRA
ncbi:MAG: protein TolR [Gammaproteobacteria bacterium]